VQLPSPAIAATCLNGCCGDDVVVFATVLVSQLRDQQQKWCLSSVQYPMQHVHYVTVSFWVYNLIYTYLIYNFEYPDQILSYMLKQKCFLITLNCCVSFISRFIVAKKCYEQGLRTFELCRYIT